MNKEVTLKKLTLVNFKALKNYSVEFGKATTIAGENGTGKTTIFDAFLWCLFGKDSTDRTDSGRGGFSVKTVDPTGKDIEKLEHTVTAELEINGKALTFTRSLVENWVKSAGKVETELRGNKTHYFVDGVEVKASQYQEQVAEVIEEQLFKLVTNPKYFPSLDWKTQREILLRIAGGVTYEEVAAGRADFLAIIEQLGGKDIDTFKEQIAYRKKTVKAELEKCPVQINAIESVTPEAKDYDALEKQKAQLVDELDQVEAAITDRAEVQRKKYGKAQQKQTQINDLLTKQQDVVFKAKQEAQRAGFEANAKRRELEARLSALESEIASCERIGKQEIAIIEEGIESQKKEIERQTKLREDKLASWKVKNAETFLWRNGGLICPIYKTRCSDASVLKLDAGAREKAEEEFNREKDEALTRISNEGRAINAAKAKAEEECKTLEGKLENRRTGLNVQLNELQVKKEELKKELLSTPELKVNTEIDAATLPEYNVYEEQIIALRKELETITAEEGPAGDTAELTARKRKLTEDLDGIKVQLAERKTRETNEAKKQEIQKREKELAQQLADIEKEEFTADELNTARMDEVERRVNGRFTKVRFRMFEKQINGAKVPACVATVNGVKYSDLNAAGKVNAGLDIINTLCLYHGVSAPIFIDNAEGVNNLFPVTSQVIRLVVSSDKELTITNY